MYMWIVSYKYRGGLYWYNCTGVETRALARAKAKELRKNGPDIGYTRVTPVSYEHYEILKEGLRG